MARRANRTQPLRDGLFTGGRLRDLVEPVRGSHKHSANDGRMHTTWLSEPVDRGSYEETFRHEADFSRDSCPKPTVWQQRSLGGPPRVSGGGGPRGDLIAQLALHIHVRCHCYMLSVAPTSPAAHSRFVHSPAPARALRSPRHRLQNQRLRLKAFT